MVAKEKIFYQLIKKKKEQSRPVDMDGFIKRSKFIVKVENNDNFCLLYNIFVVKAFVDDEKFKYECLKNPVKYFRKEVYKLANKLNLNPNEQLGVRDLINIEIYLKEYSIIVYDQTNNNKEPVYVNKQARFTKFIYLLLHKEHFYGITSIKRYFNQSYFCDYCLTAFNNIGHHNCEATCKSCRRQGCVEDLNCKLHCTFCNKKAKNNICKLEHEQSHCYKKKLCEICKSTKKKIHVCGENEKWCYNCKLADAVDHKCFILTEDELIERDKRFYKNGKKKESKFSGYIFFDIETVVEANKIHVPNLIMAAKRCVDCLNCEELCSQCSIKYEFDNVKDFGDWLMSHEHISKIIKRQFMIVD